MTGPTRERRETELGTEVRCSCCGEFWPEDKEFFFVFDGKVHSWCKACYRGNDKVIAKTERWKARQRKGEAPPQAAVIEWAPLFQALAPLQEAPHA